MSENVDLIRICKVISFNVDNLAEATLNLGDEIRHRIHALSQKTLGQPVGPHAID